MVKVRFLLFVLCLLVLACSKKQEIQNLNNNKITVLGHGGMGVEHVFPMNTYESIITCLNHGAQGTEIDIQMTKDCVLVAFHNEFLQSNNNANGQIHDKTWDELKQVWYTDPPYTQYHILRLSDLFKNPLTKQNFLFFFDAKNFNYESSVQQQELFADKIAQFIIQHHLTESVIVSDNNALTIKRYLDVYPTIKVYGDGNFEDALHLAISYNLNGISTSLSNLNVDKVQKAHDLGIKVATFNTHSIKLNKEAVALNVDIIQTDKVKHLLRYLSK